MPRARARRTSRGRPSAPAGALLACLLVMMAGGLRGCGDSEGLTGPLVPTQVDGDLTGRVFSTRDGAGLAGASVAVEGAVGVRGGTSTFDGSFEIPALTAGAYALTAQAPGFFLLRRALVVQGGAVVFEDLGLRPVTSTGAALLTIQGDGAALEGVEVLVLDTGARGRTNLAGQVTLNGLPSGNVQLVLSRQGFATRQVSVEVQPGQLTNPTFTLQTSAGSVAGVVRSTPPLALLGGALVSAPGLGVQTVTDLSGRYRLDDVPAGTFVDLIFSEPSHDPTLVTTTVVAGRSTDLNVTLQRGFGEVTGTVRQFGGGFLSGARVSVPRATLSTLTDGSGRYTFPRVPAGNNVVIGAELGGHLTEGMLLVIPPGVTTVVDFDLVPTASSIAGTIRPTDSLAGIPSVSISLPGLGLSTGTNGVGEYFFPVVPGGTHLAELVAAGFMNQTTTVVSTPGVAGISDLVMERN